MTVIAYGATVLFGTGIGVHPGFCPYDNTGQPGLQHNGGTFTAPTTINLPVGGVINEVSARVESCVVTAGYAPAIVTISVVFPDLVSLMKTPAPLLKSGVFAAPLGLTPPPPPPEGPYCSTKFAIMITA